jgi:hypothetical protein
VIRNGFIEGEIPKPRTSAPASQVPPAQPAPGALVAAQEKKPMSPALLLGAGALGTAVLATAAYFLFLKK